MGTDHIVASLVCGWLYVGKYFVDCLDAISLVAPICAWVGECGCMCGRVQFNFSGMMWSIACVS